MLISHDLQELVHFILSILQIGYLFKFTDSFLYQLTSVAINFSIIVLFNSKICI